MYYHANSDIIFFGRQYWYYFLTFRMGDGNGHTVSVTFTVSVTDVHDEAPLFTSPTNTDTINVNENDGTGFPIAISLTGSDADVMAETFTFAITTNPGGKRYVYSYESFSRFLLSWGTFRKSATS